MRGASSAAAIILELDCGWVDGREGAHVFLGLQGVVDGMSGVAAAVLGSWTSDMATRGMSGWSMVIVL